MSGDQLAVLIAIIVVIVVALIAFAVIASNRSKRERDELRSRFGSEYDRTVEARGGEKAAVADLRERERAYEGLSLRDTRDSERDEIRIRMAALQFRFVDDPNEVLLETQRVALDALRLRGYPVADNRDEALRLLSVDHPEETGPIRELLSGSYGTDTGKMRQLFLDARHALVTVVGVSYSLRDAADGLQAADSAGLASGDAERPSALDSGTREQPPAGRSEDRTAEVQPDTRPADDHGRITVNDDERPDAPTRRDQPPTTRQDAPPAEAPPPRPDTPERDR